MSTVTARCVLLASLALFLPACSTSSIRPSEPPQPPRVDCAQGWAGDPARAPRTEAVGQWIEYARSLLGIVLFERQQRALEHACVGRLKAEGVIR